MHIQKLLDFINQSIEEDEEKSEHLINYLCLAFQEEYKAKFEQMAHFLYDNTDMVFILTFPDIPKEVIPNYIDQQLFDQLKCKLNEILNDKQLFFCEYVKHSKKNKNHWVEIGLKETNKLRKIFQRVDEDALSNFQLALNIIKKMKPIQEEENRIYDACVNYYQKNSSQIVQTFYNNPYSMVFLSDNDDTYENDIADFKRLENKLQQYFDEDGWFNAHIYSGVGIKRIYIDCKSDIRKILQTEHASTLKKTSNCCFIF